MTISVSILAATLNSEVLLPRLVLSLLGTDQNFEWIIHDGGSGTIHSNCDNCPTNLQFKVISRHDFGIYDALNSTISEYKLIIILLLVQMISLIPMQSQIINKKYLNQMPIWLRPA